MEEEDEADRDRAEALEIGAEAIPFGWVAGGVGLGRDGGSADAGGTTGVGGTTGSGAGT